MIDEAFGEPEDKVIRVRGASNAIHSPQGSVVRQGLRFASGRGLRLCGVGSERPSAFMCESRVQTAIRSDV